MKIAVSSYSFSQAMRDGRMTIMDVIPKAKEMGYEGVEIVRRRLVGRRDARDGSEAEGAERGVRHADHCLHGGRGLHSQRSGRRGRAPKREAEVAALLGAPRMRHDSTGGRDANDNPVTVERRCRSWPRAIAA